VAQCNIETPTASRLNVRDDREAPLIERDGAKLIIFFRKKENGFFADRARLGEMGLNRHAK